MILKLRWDGLPDNVSIKSSANKYNVRRVLEGTELSGLEQAFIDAENIYGINALFLIGICAEESGWGTSKRAIEDNNLTGYAVYNNFSRGAIPDSKQQSILDTAKLLREDYIDKGLLSIDQINEKYAANDLWSDNIVSIANGLVIKSKF